MQGSVRDMRRFWLILDTDGDRQRQMDWQGGGSCRYARIVLLHVLELEKVGWLDLGEGVKRGYTNGNERKARGSEAIL